jgi:hypothetical protein
MKTMFSQKLKTGAIAAGILAAAMLAGFLIGRGAGNRFVSGILLRESRFPLLLSRPVYQFYDIYTLINSSDPFSRLSGYYSLVDANMIDLEFIRERYSQEQMPVVRRTLLWVLGYSKDRSAVLDYYASLYRTSDDDMKNVILAMMKRLDPDYHREFIKKNRVPAAPRPGK